MDITTMKLSCDEFVEEAAELWVATMELDGQPRPLTRPFDLSVQRPLSRIRLIQEQMTNKSILGNG
jgi:hypothetical protein